MFKKILVAADGSDLDHRAAKLALNLASSLSAQVLFAYIVFPYTVANIEFPIPSGLLPTHAEYEKAKRERVLRILGPIETLAKQTSVPFDSKTIEHAQPWRGLLQIANEEHCDVICMASHGRSGLSALLLGSETQKVLAHSHLPVLVVR